MHILYTHFDVVGIIRLYPCVLFGTNNDASVQYTFISAPLSDKLKLKKRNISCNQPRNERMFGTGDTQALSIPRTTRAI